MQSALRFVKGSAPEIPIIVITCGNEYKTKAATSTEKLHEREIKFTLTCMRNSNPLISIFPPTNRDDKAQQTQPGFFPPSCFCFWHVTINQPRSEEKNNQTYNTNYLRSSRPFLRHRQTKESTPVLKKNLFPV